MAVTDVILRPSREGSSKETGLRTYSRKYIVICNTPNEPEPSVGSAFGLPGVNSPHPSDPTCRCAELKLSQREEERYFWDVEATYTNEPKTPAAQSQTSNPTPTNPLTEPAKVKIKSKHYEEPLVKDKDDEAVLNSAGDYFDPPPMKDSSRWTISITKNVASVPSGFLDYIDTVNDGSITIAGIPLAARQAKISDINVDPMSANGTKYLQVQYDIDLKKGPGFVHNILDQGLYHNQLGKHIPCTLEDGTIATTPQGLDGTGQQAMMPVTPVSAVFLDFYAYEEMDFSALDLPLTPWG